MKRSNPSWMFLQKSVFFTQRKSYVQHKIQHSYIVFSISAKHSQGVEEGKRILRSGGQILFIDN